MGRDRSARGPFLWGDTWRWARVKGGTAAFRSRSRSRPGEPPPPGEPPAPCAAPDDAALVAAARAHPPAFAALYERYVGRVYGYCYLRLGSREAAEDATGEVFAKAYAALPRYHDLSFAAWIFRIANNAVIDAYRARRPSAPLEAAGDPPDPARSPEELAIAGDERAAVRAALARLPDDQRAAVELGYAGWSGREIALALGRSPEAVKQLRFRGLNRLRSFLIQPDAPPGPRDEGAAR